MNIEATRLAAIVAALEADNPPARFATREAAERIAAYYIGRNNAQCGPEDPEHVYLVRAVDRVGSAYVITAELHFHDEDSTTVTLLGHLSEEAVINAEFALDEHG